MQLGIEPTVDYAFKKVFGTEGNIPVLENLLEAVLKPPADLRPFDLVIANPFNEKEAPDDKLSILDIKARDRQGRQYNIEMQIVATPIYPHRVLYYWAVVHGEQLREGQKYARLQPTISISFVKGTLFPDALEYHLDFQLRCSQHPELIFSDQQSVHLIELPKFRLSLDQLTDDLGAWCYFLVHGARLDPDNLPAQLQRPAIVRAMEVLKMLAQNAVERERYEARLKGWRDRVSEIEDTRKDALERGELIGRIHLCERLLKRPHSPAEDLVALPIADLKARAAVLEQQAGATGP